ncbi:MAG: exopolysaccharide biosynthesis polyprenyl glycosylphosphotransferase, partial [Thermodesulfovibrionales bacterium]
KSSELLNTVMEAKVKGVEIIDMPTFYEELEGKLPVEHLSNGWFIFAPFYGMRKNIYTNHLKRLIDIFLAIVGVIAVSPVICITSLAIKLDSPGSLLFRQRRVGYNGEVFELLKFRSMEVDAEKDGAVWAQKNDPRVTRVGKIIRKARVDEIPQIWNVLKGEMSFVGPRPERPEFVDQLQIEIPFYSLRNSVKPGISGWAQVLYPYGASKKDALEKLQYDLYYIKNLSFFLDLHIVLKTIRVVLFGRGAR